MLTLEIYGRYVTWPEQFALFMMRYYRNRGIKFVVHRNCIHSGWDTTREKTFAFGKTERVGVFEYVCSDR